MSGIYTYRSGEFLRMPAAEVIGDPFIANPGPRMWFNATAFPGTAGLYYARTNPYQYDQHHGTDHVERGRYRVEGVSDSGTIIQNLKYGWKPIARPIR